MENIILVGFILIIIGIIIITIGSLNSKNAKVAIGGFIGPLPFGWANDPQMLKWIIILTAIISIIFVIVFLRGFL
ncbi:MAG: DUF131 domain-containing protein [Candidatus Aenigmatarchaeota archaeon]